MRKVIEEIGFWILKQEWFQFEVVKFTTKTIEESKNNEDDAVLAFLSRNKVELKAIAEREAKLSETKFDDKLVEALKTL
jgi:hypothetical protein